MLDYSPIGFFDSGYGGLTVLKEVQKQMPDYDYLYLGDNARAPYGTRSSEVVFEYTWEAVQVLFKNGCDLVVLACNTASAKALRKIQQEKLVDFPNKRVLGVIRPSAEIVGDFSLSNDIVILGTNGTITSKAYIEEFSLLSPKTLVNQYACPLWVPLIENNDYRSPEGMAFIKNDIDKVLQLFPNSDVILLGCTHYPILQNIIENLVPSHIKVVSQGGIVAKSLKSYLERHNWLNQMLTRKGKTNYLTTENANAFEELASLILDMNVHAKNIKLNSWH